MTETEADARDRRADRRSQRKPLYFPERRTGFERRSRDGWRGAYESNLQIYRDNPTTFMLVLATIVVFNFIDYQLTIRVLDAGGTELNPIMARLFDMSPLTAAAAKLGTVGVIAVVLLAMRRYRRTLEVSILLLLGYTLLMFYHAGLLITGPAA